MGQRWETEAVVSGNKKSGIVVVPGTEKNLVLLIFVLVLEGYVIFHLKRFILNCWACVGPTNKRAINYFAVRFDHG